ncbi:MAG: glutamine--tRNA ligase, partial [Clostridia bacterium]|nr:glutamine--tRNA ligase [Clostridia bacterium]
WDEWRFEDIELQNNPNDDCGGSHTVRFGKELYIDAGDFSLNPPPKYYRLVKGGMIRLKGAYILKYSSVDMAEDGGVAAVHCEYIERSKSGEENSGIKVKATVQWLCCEDAVPAKLYKYFSLLEDESEGRTRFDERINKNSLEIVSGALVEPYLMSQPVGSSFQFIREAYYKLAAKGNFGMEFNRIVELKDSFKVITL